MSEPKTWIFRDLEYEHGWKALEIEGTLPPDLRGRLYRNGPARSLFVRFAHWFDARGALVSVDLDGQGAKAAIKLVETNTLRIDQRGPVHSAYASDSHPWQRLKGLFGGRANGNMANTSVLAWQGGLYTLFEFNPPVVFDPETLLCGDEVVLGGVAKVGIGHAHRLPKRGTTVWVGQNPGAKVTLDVFLLPDAGPATKLTSLPLPGLTELHDFLVTESAVILVLAPLWANPLKVALTGRFRDSLAWDGAGQTEVVVIPLDRPDAIERHKVPPFFFWHGANAWDEPDGSLGMLLVRYDDFASDLWFQRVAEGYAELPSGARLTAMRLDRRTGAFTQTPVWDGSGEFPYIHPGYKGSPHRYTWLAAHRPETGGRGWWDRLVRHDRQTGEVRWIDPGPDRLVGEPMVVPRSDREDDVWILSIVRDLSRNLSHLAVWDGEHPTDAPVARAWFDQQLHHTLHGVFLPAAEARTGVR